MRLSSKFLLYVILPVSVMGIIMSLGINRFFQNQFDAFLRGRTEIRMMYELNPYLPPAPPDRRPFEQARRVASLSIVFSFILSFGSSLAVAMVLSGIFQRRIAGSLVQLANAANKIENGEEVNTSEVGFSIEIRELGKRIEELSKRLMERSMARKAMTSSVYHEIMTPLGVIKMQLEALQDGMIKYDDDLAEKMLASVDHITEVLKDLKNIEGGEMNYSVDEFDAGFESEEVGKSFITLFESRRIEFSSSFGRVYLEGDRQRFRQVIFNLLSNAVKYTPYEGKVSLIIDRDSIRVLNTSNYEIPEPSKYGTGLNFVERFCEFHGWTLKFGRLNGSIVAKISFR